MHFLATILVLYLQNIIPYAPLPLFLDGLIKGLCHEGNSGSISVFIKARQERYMLRKIRLIDSNAKCHHLNNLSVKGLCGRFLSVWGQEPHTSPLTKGRVGGGRGEPERRLRGETVHDHNMTDFFAILQTLINTCRKVPLQVNFFKCRRFALVYQFLLSMYSNCRVRILNIITF